MKNLQSFDEFVNESQLNEGPGTPIPDLSKVKPKAPHSTFETENFIKEIKNSAFANKEDLLRFIGAVVQKAALWSSNHKFNMNNSTLVWLADIYAKETGKNAETVKLTIAHSMDSIKNEVKQANYNVKFNKR